MLWNWTPGGREDEFVTFGAKHVRFWRGRNGRWAPQGPQWGAAAPQDVNCAAFLPLGLVATGHPSGEVYLWRDRRVVRTVAVHPGPAGGLGVGCMKLHVNKADARVAQRHFRNDKREKEGRGGAETREKDEHPHGDRPAPAHQEPGCKSGIAEQVQRHRAGVRCAVRVLKDCSFRSCLL